MDQRVCATALRKKWSSPNWTCQIDPLLLLRPWLWQMWESWPTSSPAKLHHSLHCHLLSFNASVQSNRRGQSVNGSLHSLLISNHSMSLGLRKHTAGMKLTVEILSGDLLHQVSSSSPWLPYQLNWQSYLIFAASVKHKQNHKAGLKLTKQLTATLRKLTVGVWRWRAINTNLQMWYTQRTPTDIWMHYGTVQCVYCFCSLHTQQLPSSMNCQVGPPSKALCLPLHTGYIEDSQRKNDANKVLPTSTVSCSGRFTLLANSLTVLTKFLWNNCYGQH